LAALEKGSAERAAAVASRERVLAECEEKVASREVELEGLKAHLTRLLSGLDAHREAEQQVLAGHTARLSKEAARLEALQVRNTILTAVGLLASLQGAAAQPDLSRARQHASYAAVHQVQG
jgi:hypothetical protein